MGLKLKLSSRRVELRDGGKERLSFDVIIGGFGLSCVWRKIYFLVFLVI